MNFDNVINSLEQLIDANVDLVSIPYTKGNSIRIKNFAIRKNKTGYAIYDCKENCFVSSLAFKLSALALAKCLAENKNYIKEIEQLDHTLLQHYNDVVFYRNTIKKTNNKFVKEIRRIRLDVSLEKVIYAKQKLEDFVF